MDQMLWMQEKCFDKFSRETCFLLQEEIENEEWTETIQKLHESKV